MNIHSLMKFLVVYSYAFISPEWIGLTINYLVFWGYTSMQDEVYSTLDNRLILTMIRKFMVVQSVTFNSQAEMKFNSQGRIGLTNYC